MLFYYPQWQGSGTGEAMHEGASNVIKYINRPYHSVPLSIKPLSTKADINGFDTLYEQLLGFRELLVDLEPDTLQTVGGDCGLEIIPVSYLASKYQNLGVIWFDAHADFNLPEESPSNNFHGMPLRTLIGEGNEQFKSLLFNPIAPQQIHYLGLRSVDRVEQKQLDSYQVYTGFKPSIEDLINTLKSKQITSLYIHFDVDCLDPAEFDKSYYKVANGLTINESLDYIEVLKANFKIVGTSLLETVVTNEKELHPIREIINQLFN